MDMKKLLLFTFTFFCCHMIVLAQPNNVKTEAEQMPYFSGCDEYESMSAEKRECSNLALVTFISQSVEYPEAAKTAGLEGTVYVSFIVNKNGRISDGVILKDIGGNCGKEAIRVIENMPPWVPAYDDGFPVAVKLNMPIQFKMRDEEPDLADQYQIDWGKLNGGKITKKELIANLDKEIIVRDDYGNDIPMSTLEFAYERKRTFLEAKSTGTITSKMKKIVTKVKGGGVFVVSATLHKNGEFLDIFESFEIIED